MKIEQLIVIFGILFGLLIFTTAVATSVITEHAHDGYMYRCTQENPTEICNKFWRYVN